MKGYCKADGCLEAAFVGEYCLDHSPKQYPATPSAPHILKTAIGHMEVREKAKPQAAATIPSFQYTGSVRDYLNNCIPVTK